MNISRLFLLLLILCPEFFPLRAQFAQSPDSSLQWGGILGFDATGLHPGPEATFRNMTDSLAFLSTPVGAGLGQFVFSARIRDLHCRPGKKYPFTTSSGDVKKALSPGCGIWIGNKEGDFLYAMVSPPRHGAIDDLSPLTEITVGWRSGGVTATPVSITPSGPLFSDFPEEITLLLSRDNSGTFHLEAGFTSLREVWSGRLDMFHVEQSGYCLQPGGALQALDARFEWHNDGTSLLHTPWCDDPPALLQRMRLSADPLEGYWAYFDRVFEEDLLRPGGRYELVMVKRAPGAYDLIYWGGAEVNASAWHRGMLKGRLTAAPSGMGWNLQWFDAEGIMMSHGLTASLEDAATLILIFPYQDSQMRLHKNVFPPDSAR